jgi:hypothetical protein
MEVQSVPPENPAMQREKKYAGQAPAISLRQFHYRSAILALGALRFTTSV